MKKPYVILISADGFRFDLAQKDHAENLLKYAKNGVQAEYMQSCFPSLTFPNHYAIATGMYPAHNGLVDNNMYDRKKNQTYGISNRKAVTDSSWYGGVPIWVLAEQQNMLSASYYWVGSEAAVDGVRPTYYYEYSEKLGIDARLAEVKKWLELPEDQRPHLIMFYLPEVDHAEHKTGPDSKQTQEAVAFVDSAIKKMNDSLAELNLDIDYIFVSDHGMTLADTQNPLTLPSSVDTNLFKVAGGGTIIHLYANNASDVMPAYEKIQKDAIDFDVYLANNIPARWHYSARDDKYGRIGDIILIPHFPKVFTLGKYPPQMGQHGYDPIITDMHATFYAWGPDFKEHLKIPSFENIHIYPLVAEILGLDIDQKIDGNINFLKKILK